MPKPRPALAALLAAVLTFTVARPAAAQLALPPAPETAADAATSFGTRADAVLTFNASGREAQFAPARAARRTRGSARAAPATA
jgi:hypothetical protein